MKTRLVLCIFLLLVASCDTSEQEDFSTPFIPIGEGTGLRFRGYVTDAEQELIGDIHYFTREYSHADTIDGLPVVAFWSGDTKSFVHQDSAGTISELVSIDLRKWLLPYGVNTRKPVFITYWDKRFSKEEGVGTEWQTTVDTVISAYDMAGKPLQMRYYYLAKARFDGWSQTALPSTQRVEKVLDVEVYDLQNYIINLTTGDSLFVKQGTAHYYFLPRTGMVKYISDYRLKDRRESNVRRYSTWELLDESLDDS